MVQYLDLIQKQDFGVLQKLDLSEVYFESNCGEFTYSTVLNEASVSTQSVVQLDGTIGSDCSIEVNLLVYDAYTGITCNANTEAYDHLCHNHYN